MILIDRAIINMQKIILGSMFLSGFTLFNPLWGTLRSFLFINFLLILLETGWQKRKTHCVACTAIHSVSIVDETILLAIKTNKIIRLEVPVVVELVFNVLYSIRFVKTFVFNEELVLLLS